MSELREKMWTKYVTEIGAYMQQGCKEVFKAGLMTIGGRDAPSARDRLGWPPDLLQAYSEQENIGWIQVLYGRLSTKWERCFSELVDENQIIQHRRTRQLIQQSWTYGLDVWTLRNELVHGSEGQVSKLDQLRVAELIKVLYRELRPRIDSYQQKQLFPYTEPEMLHHPYHSQIAWTEQLRFLYPEMYIEIASTAMGRHQAMRGLDMAQAKGGRQFEYD